jgi:hypothetical protein
MFPSIVENVADRLEEECFPVLHKWLKEQDVTSDELGEACRAYIEFMQTAHLNPDETCQQALERVGWFEVRDEARIAYIFYIGSQLMGTMWHGLRDVAAITDDVLDDMTRLTGLADRMQLALSKPKWRRRISRLWQRLRQWAIRKLQGGSS